MNKILAGVRTFFLGFLPWSSLIAASFSLLAGCSNVWHAQNAGTPSVVLRDASELKFAVPADSSCPAHWADDTFYIFVSTEYATRLSGPNLFQLTAAEPVKWDTDEKKSRWIEATYKDEDGTLYGWYHHEKGPVCRNRLPRYYAAAAIGAGVSYDNGATWRDLGFIIDDRDETFNCETLNKYFPGGSGDCSVVVDRKKEYIYFLFSTYGKDIAQQGVSIARMRFADRDAPAGKVWKWYKNGWTEPGLYGKVTPVFTAFRDWHSANPDAFWGPSVHWNTYLNCYVMLLNRAIDQNWWQEGICISYNADVSKPANWSTPQRIRKDGSWYPLIVGTEKGQSDKLAGQKARYFEQGVSLWEIEFVKPQETSN
ncbi:MAG: hypothetical protein LLF76_00780 [Planctomycetaceae bacterium]|nr:hypothetical protein [Planctomycetaceae bacterium]